MIIYFSGTGNSAYIAKKIASKTGDSLLSLNEIIKDSSPVTIPDEPLLFVAPTYGYRIPRIVSEWIERTDFSANQKVWFILNCGDSVGTAEKHLKALCSKKALAYMGLMEILMPENYIALFPIPTEAESAEIIAAADPLISKAAERFKTALPFSALKLGTLDRFKGAFINKFFYAFVISAKSFRAKDSCIGCGICAELCPTNNIQIVDKSPLWGDKCTHCMACICRCPEEAIEYGKRSVGKRRYFLS